MRQLHVVALSEDGRFLLLAPTKETGKDGAKAVKPSFKIPLDARLTAAVRGELPRPGQTTAPVSGLTPKEIQARLRAGESVEQVARAAGVPAARVERFAGPVEGERARTIDAARAAVLTRARRGASAVSLGDAVTEHLVDAGVDPTDVEWTARREDSGTWLVGAAFSVRGRKKRSTWRYEPSTRDLTAVDASSAVLGYVEPPQESHPVTKVVSAVKPAPRRKAAGKGRSAAAPQVPAAAKAPATKAAARKPATVLPKAPAPSKPSSRTSAKPRAAVTASPPAAARPKAGAGTTISARPASTTIRPSADAAPARKKAPAAKKATPPAAPPAAAAAAPTEPDGPPQLRVVPAPHDEPRQRASVPAWADVLLSTTPPSRPAEARSDDE